MFIPPVAECNEAPWLSKPSPSEQRTQPVLCSEAVVRTLQVHASNLLPHWVIDPSLLFVVLYFISGKTFKRRGVAAKDHFHSLHDDKASSTSGLTGYFNMSLINVGVAELAHLKTG